MAIDEDIARPMNSRFGALITAMATPFDAEGAVDLAAAEQLASWLAEHGSDGLVVTGSTGEASTLTDDEKIELWAAVKKAAGGKAKIIAGSGSNDTAHSVHLTKKAHELGLDGALVVTPYYNRPPQAGLIAHFSAIATASDIPLMLYDIPVRTARKIDHATLLRLAEVDNIVAVKDACGDAQGAARLVAEAPPDFEVYCGNDADTLPWLSVGAVGVVSVASHLVGPQMAQMVRLFWEGDAAAARKIHLDLMPVFDVLAMTTNPIPLKAALEMAGHRAGDPRLPLVPATETEKDKIRGVLSKAGVI
ncbi:MAG: 4-hydroxy-tetrahydrodipicolinate synthase [Actinomycetota bacterium]